jgi:hypothetical protein
VLAGAVASLAEAGAGITSADAMTIPANARYFMDVSSRSHNRDIDTISRIENCSLRVKRSVTTCLWRVFPMFAKMNCHLFPFLRWERFERARVLSWIETQGG